MSATNKLFKNISDTSFVVSDFNKLSTSHGEQSEPITELSRWIQDTGILSSLTYSVSSKSEKSNNIVRFSLSDSHQSYYPLLRSLLSMGTTFYFRSDTKAKAFTVEIRESQFHSFKEHIKRIVTLLKAEMSFKIALRYIIAFEEEISGQQKALETTLRNSLLV